jgi:ABC-type lipoprotein release transport system permease subunit
MAIEREASPPSRRRGVRVRQWMDLLSAVVMAAATVACVIPATRATSIEPLDALRTQ